MLKKYKMRSYNIRLVFLIVLTTIFGIVVINSADSSYTIRQCAGFGFSLAVMFLISFVDYNWLLRYYWIFYFVNIVLLLLVKVAGHSSNNAQRWINIGFTFQPSELTKIIMIVFVAKLISLYKTEINNWKFLLFLIISCAIPLLLILKQPDLSTTILITLIIVTIVFSSGLSYKIIGMVLLILIPLLVGFMVYIGNPDQKLIKPYQRDRIMAFVQPEKYSDGTYQQENAVKAIGSGKLTGKGLNNDDPSSMNNAHLIPEGHTDFIFAVIGEELGFTGCCAAILLLSCIVIECIITAVKAKNFAGRLICCGVAAYIAFQSTINICVVTQIMPNTGLPLPFFSYGLTSLVVLYVSMGIVLNISLQRNVERDDEIYSEDFRG